MNRPFAILAIAAICLALGSLNVSRRKAAERAVQEAAWQKLKAQREAELEALNAQARSMARTPVFPQAQRELLPESKRKPIPSKSGAQSQTAKEPAATITNSPAVDVAEARPPARQASGKKGELKDPLAREALSFVGADPAAELIWAEAINNPDLPPNERKDLIEDLNEDGFPDPKNITMDDLPLIVSRLALIEDNAGDAMDEVNWAAFMEAYKDLLKMYVRLAGF